MAGESVTPIHVQHFTDSLVMSHSSSIMGKRKVTCKCFATALKKLCNHCKQPTVDPDIVLHSYTMP